MTVSERFLTMKSVLTVLLLGFSFLSQASSIIVTGKGANKKAALSYAFQIAAEKSYGIYLYAESRTKNLELTYDEIITITRGFVKDYKILNKTKNDGLIYLTIRVNIKNDPVIDAIYDKAQKRWGDIIKDKAKIKQYQKRLRAYANILKKYAKNSDRILKHGYTIEPAGYIIDDIGMDYVKGFALVHISPNQLFWDNYLKILKMMRIKKGNTVKAGMFGSVNKLLCARGADIMRRDHFGYTNNIIGIPNATNVHKSMMPHLVKPVKIKLTIKSKKSENITIKSYKISTEITLFKNAIIHGNYERFPKKYKTYDETMEKCAKDLKQQNTLYSFINFDDFFKRIDFYVFEKTQQSKHIFKGDKNSTHFSNYNKKSVISVSDYSIMKIPFSLKNESQLKQIDFDDLNLVIVR